MEAPPTFNDIILPAAPPAPVAQYAPTLALALLALVVILVLWWSLRRWLRLRALKHLLRDWQHNVYDNRDAVFLLAAELRHKQMAKRLTPDSALWSSARQQAQWDAFVDRLDRIRYRTGALASNEVRELFMQTRYWLLQSRPRRRSRRTKC